MNKVSFLQSETLISIIFYLVLLKLSVCVVHFYMHLVALARKQCCYQNSFSFFFFFFFFFFFCLV